MAAAGIPQVMIALDPKAVLENAARARPRRWRAASAASQTGRSRGCSSTPTIVLLLAINIFPLLWTIRLSFTITGPTGPTRRYWAWASTTTSRCLTDPDVWAAMQATAHFLLWTILPANAPGFMLAYLIDRRFRGHGFWTTVILIPMMLSPAVGRHFWAFLYQPQIGLFNHARRVLHRHSPSSFRDDRLGQAGAMVDHHRSTPDVDAVRECSSALPACAQIPEYIYEAAVSGPCFEVAAVLVDHAAMALPFHSCWPCCFRRDRELPRCSIW